MPTHASAGRGILTGILTGVLALSTLTGTGGEGGGDAVEVLVRAESSTAAAAIVDANGGEVRRSLDIVDGVAAAVPVRRMDALLRTAGVVDVTPNSVIEFAGMRTSRGAADEAARDVRKAERNAAKDELGITPRDAVALLGGSWLDDEGYDGSGVDIAIVDSGVADLNHFGKRVERPIDLSGVPDQGRDGTGHGTAMASIAGLKHGPDSGVADDVGIIDVKVAAEGAATDVSQVIAGIDWVVANRNTDGRNIRVLSLSFGTDGGQAYTDSPLAMAVEQAWRNGIVVVVAAGNHGSSLGRLAMPAVDPYVLAVGAVDLHETTATSDDTVPEWSARGDGVRNPDVLAPGVSILAAMHDGAAAVQENGELFDHGMLPGSGTSQATAFTAGVVASLLEANPALTPDAVKALLVETARPLAGLDGPSAGSGVIDLGAIAERRLAQPTLADFLARQQDHGWSLGTGTLDGDRGTFRVLLEDGEVIDGDETPFGHFDGDRWREAVAAGSTWTGSTWTGSTWTGSTWTGSTWTGSTWTGSTWTGSTWTGSTWTSTWTVVSWR